MLKYVKTCSSYISAGLFIHQQGTKTGLRLCWCRLDLPCWCCCNSNSALHERDHRISQLAFAVAWKGNAAKLSSLEIWLNDSKLQSLKESYGNYLWLILGNKNRVNFVVPKFHCTELEKNQWYAAIIKICNF